MVVIKSTATLTVLQGKQLVNLTGLAFQNQLALPEKFYKHNTDAVTLWKALLMPEEK